MLGFMNGLEIWTIVMLILQIAAIGVTAYIAILVIKALRKYLRS